MMANLNGSSSAVTAIEVKSASDNGDTTTTIAAMSSSPSSSSSLDDLQRVNEFFEANSNAIERWLKERASDDVISRLHSIIRNKEKVIDREHHHRSSVTSELYQQWLSSSMKVSKKNPLLFTYLLMFATKKL